MVIPSELAAYIGRTIKVKCISETTVQWKNKNKLYKPNIHNVLTIKKVKLYHTGIYTCKGTDNYGIIFQTPFLLWVGSKLL